MPTESDGHTPKAGTGGDDAGNRNNRHRQNRNNRRQNRNNQTPKASRFVGRETTLRDHIYDLHDLQATQSDQFTKTTKEIANFVGRTFSKYTGALVTSVETFCWFATMCFKIYPSHTFQSCGILFGSRKVGFSKC
jgi:hypothetical protein